MDSVDPVDCLDWARPEDLCRINPWKSPGLPFSYVFHCFPHWKDKFFEMHSPALHVSWTMPQVRWCRLLKSLAHGLPPWTAGKWVREYPFRTSDIPAIVSHVNINHGCLWAYDDCALIISSVLSWLRGKNTIWIVFLVVLLSMQTQLLANSGDLGQNGFSCLVVRSVWSIIRLGSVPLSICMDLVCWRGSCSRFNQDELGPDRAIILDLTRSPIS